MIIKLEVETGSSTHALLLEAVNVRQRELTDQARIARRHECLECGNAILAELEPELTELNGLRLRLMNPRLFADAAVPS